MSLSSFARLLLGSRRRSLGSPSLHRRSHRCRRPANPFERRAAEVLESRVLLSATLFVDPASTKPSVFHTIQAAVNAASSGSTIKVAPAVYDEDVTVSKPLTILGGQVQLRGETGPSTVEFQSAGFTVSANNVTINGFTLEPNPDSTNAPLFAILAANSARARFTNNVINNSELALGGGVTNSQVANNSGDFQIEVINATSSAANGNDTFTDNTINGGSVFLSDTATGAVLTGNTVENGGGFENIANNVKFVGNTANNNEEGFTDFGGGTETFTKNVADDNGDTGFDISANGTVSMTGNTATGNGTGIDVFGTGATTLLSNTANANTYLGIEVSGSGSPTLRLNTASNNLEIGFSVNGASPTLISNVADGDSEFGFSVDGQTTSLKGNTANSAGETGFEISTNTGTLSGNTANNCATAGFNVTSTGSMSVTGNTATSDGEAGFQLSLAGGTISGNTANANQGAASDPNAGGFVISGSDLTITNNVARNNVSNGIALSSLTGSVLSGNTATTNGNDGIFADVNSTGNTLTKNKATGNTSFDLADDSTGTGTAGTANTWTKNTANTTNPPGL
jgi:parallel beta-helix repeat protein